MEVWFFTTFNTKQNTNHMKKFYKKTVKWSLTFLAIAFLGLVLAAVVVYFKKDYLIDQVLQHANEDFKGRVQIEKATISPFENFPYISIKLDHLKVFETKETAGAAIIDVETAYLGFNFWNIVKNELIIKKLALENGRLSVVQDELGQFNILKAFESVQDKKEESSEPLLIDFDEIVLKKIAVNKENLVTKIAIQINIDETLASFSKTNEDIKLRLDSKFVLNVLQHGKPTYIHHKHLELHTDFVFHKKTQIVDFLKTTVQLEGAEFDMSGKIDIDDELFVDLHFSGNKPNFDLVIGFAPEELIPTLRSYDNNGKLYFDATIKGKTANNQMPAIQAKFGCEEGFIHNPETNKKIDKLGFYCTFTNGAKRNNSTSVFELKDFNAKPEAGDFKAKLKVQNFDSPEIDMQLDSDFDLDFLTQFFKLKELKNLNGKVLLSMKFHDIIDLKHPEKALEKLNQAYFSKLEIKNLNFKSNKYHLPLQNLNVAASVKGKTLEIQKCSFQLGDSDLSIQGKIGNIIAVIHQANENVDTELHLQSKTIDLGKLIPKTPNKEPFDEVVSDLKFDLAFKGLAKTFISSKSLPVGNYYLTNISSKLKHYQHKLDHFNGVFYINEKDVLIKRLDGKIDTSDFHFEGKIGHYNLWLADKKAGDTDIEFDLKSNALHFDEIFTYKGKNYMPEEYRNEDLKNVKIHGRVALHYQETLRSTDFYLTELRGKLKMHPLTFNHFKGNIHLENDILAIKNFSGQLGDNEFKLNGKYYLKNKNAFHEINFQSNRLHFNELMTYHPPKSASNEKKDHDAGFNVFAEPFPNVFFKAKIKDLRFNNFHLTNISAKAKVQENHYVYLNQLQFNAASGLVDISGYFNGSNPKHIYLNPDIKIQKVNLDEVLLKFDNFGQDQLVSDNLHGVTSGRIKGKIWLHTDFTPSINDSNLTIDVAIENGRLDNFAPMQAMASFFGDKNLNRIKFDKLENRLTLKNGTLSFPNMLINSSLGFIEISGHQDLNLNMDYYVRVPLKLVGKAAFGKLFNKQPKEISPEQEDELIVKDPTKNTRFINVRMVGTPEKFDIKLQKNKELKSGMQSDKKEDFLFKNIESEFEGEE